MFNCKLIVLILIAFFSFNSHSSDKIKVFLNSYNYEKTQNYKDAIKSLLPEFEKSPTEYVLNLRLAWLYYLTGKFQNSKQHYQQAIKVSPMSIQAKNGLVLCYLAQFKYDEAEKSVHEVVKLDYYNYYGNIHLISSLIGQRKLELAEVVIKKMLGLYPTDVIFLSKLLYVQEQLSKATKVPKTAEYILLLDPNNVYAGKVLSKLNAKTKVSK